MALKIPNRATVEASGDVLLLINLFPAGCFYSTLAHCFF